MRSRVEKLIETRMHAMFEKESVLVSNGTRRQISLRPDAVTLCQIDTLADILDESRQQLMDDLLESAMMDAIDAYCDAYGPDHSEDARKGFVEAFKKRWNETYSEGDQ